jgi:hypothetical protein
MNEAARINYEVLHRLISKASNFNSGQRMALCIVSLFLLYYTVLSMFLIQVYSI